MAYLTLDRARAATTLRGRQPLAEAELRKFAQAPTTTRFDAFLSHSRLDADVILGVKNLLEAQGLAVYVDWIDDPQLDRAHVTAATAAQIKLRMGHCASLIFATSESSPKSKWMPWELGYFDGSNGHIGILPLVETAGENFKGQEYLGLYPLIQDVAALDNRPNLGIRDSAGAFHGVGRLPHLSFRVR
jgi:hypothetical protein